MPTNTTETPTPPLPAKSTSGDLTVNRLGFGAMRITGPGIWVHPKITTPRSKPSAVRWN